MTVPSRPFVLPSAWALMCLLAGGAASAARPAESIALKHHAQLTFPDRFERAGEAYFSPEGRWIIFQATARPAEGAPPDPHYAMYVARLVRDESGRVTGTEEPILISPPGTANTCGFFHPIHAHRVIFGSTLTPPDVNARAGFQRGQSRYVWQFPSEMEVVKRTVLEIFHDLNREGDPNIVVGWGEDALTPQPLWRRPGYDAECAYSPCGRFIVFTAVDDDTADPDIHIFDTETGVSHPIVVAPGYDGGPFFSPCGQRICYRSDRRGDDRLQIFVGDLKFEKGVPVGLRAEHQLSADEHVNWAPYWHPSGEFLVYTSSRAGHDNYEVFSIEAPPLGAAAALNPAERATPRRITHAPGFDGMPVFSADGAFMMWTSQRGAAEMPGARPSSQVWIAEVVDVRP